MNIFQGVKMMPLNHIGYWQNAVILCLQGINQIMLVDLFDRSEQD